MLFTSTASPETLASSPAIFVLSSVLSSDISFLDAFNLKITQPKPITVIAGVLPIPLKAQQ
jgi:hypothetical protein